jgi:GNAT superfamily N-acetyltransferase
MNEKLHIIRLAGSELQPYISDLASLRIEIFRSFPYLYDGDMAYEKKYLQTYIDCPHAMMVIVKEGDQVVGASTGIPLIYETEQCKAPFQKANIHLNDVFYCGESLLLPAYRGRGIYHHYFTEREAIARAHNCTMTTFFAVNRPEDHPRRPANWRPLNDFWNSQRYTKHPKINTTYQWKDLDEESESPKPMIAWIKNL